MTDAQFYGLLYAFFLAVRIPTNLKRYRLPLMRGTGYFFNTPVGPDFYQGPGRDVLRRYRLSLLVPFLFDAVALAFIYRFGAPIHLMWLALADMVLSLGNHMLAMKRAVRKLEPFTTQESRTVSALAFSLTPRRLRDYTSLPLELIIASFNIGALWPFLHESSWALHKPVLLLYIQAGLFLIKYALITSRTALPQENTDQYLQWREAYRRLMTKSCDGVRLMTSAAMLAPAFDIDRTTLLLCTLAAMTIWVFWYARQARRVMALYTAAKPVRLPSMLEPEQGVPPMICFRPATPLSFVKGARGWALNLGNFRAQVGVAYIVGLVVVRTLLP